MKAAVPEDLLLMVMQVQIVLHLAMLPCICLGAHKQPVAAPAHELVPVVHTGRRPFGRARHVSELVRPACSQAPELRHVLFRQLPAPGESLEVRCEAVWVDALGDNLGDHMKVRTGVIYPVLL